LLRAERLIRCVFFKTPLDIQDACNPSGVAYAFLEACEKARKEGYDTRMLCTDSAIRLIAYKLSDLVRATKLDDLAEYSRVTAHYKEQAATDGLAAAPERMAKRQFGDLEEIGLD
jgi:hypothetical protein